MKSGFPQIVDFEAQQAVPPATPATRAPLRHQHSVPFAHLVPVGRSADRATVFFANVYFQYRSTYGGRYLEGGSRQLTDRLWRLSIADGSPVWTEVPLPTEVTQGRMLEHELKEVISTISDPDFRQAMLDQLPIQSELSKLIGTSGIVAVLVE